MVLGGIIILRKYSQFEGDGALSPWRFSHVAQLSPETEACVHILYTCIFNTILKIYRYNFSVQIFQITLLEELGSSNILPFHIASNYYIIGNAIVAAKTYQRKTKFQKFPVFLFPTEFNS